MNLIERLSVYKTYSPKHKKNVIQLLAAVGITLMTASAGFAESVFPSNLSNKRGSSTPQPLEVLGVKDQQGSDDNFDKYIEFNSDQDGYVGDFRFNLPAMPDREIQKLILHANYRGPENSFQKWEFELLDVKTGNWVYVADNRDVADWSWSNITATITDPGQFINGRSQITLRYVAKNKGDSSQLDFVTFEIKSLQSKRPMEASGTASDRGSNGSRWQPAPGLKWQINILTRLIPLCMSTFTIST